MAAHFLAFATALVASVSLTPAVRQLALRLGLVDRPGPRKIHLTPIPLLGGLAIYLAAVLTIMFLVDRSAWGQVVGVTGAFNILDHMDGLCAGITAIASAFFLFFAVQGGQVLVGTLAAAMLGAALGFLWWNFNPARIFMGDGGAIFLGFMMATLGLKLHLPQLSPATRWIIPVLILGVPIFDTTLVTISRMRRSLPPHAAAGKDHTAHRLANLGLGQRGAVLCLYGLGGLFGLLALLVSRLSVGWSYVLAAVVIVVGLLCIGALERAPFERQ